MLDNSNNDSAEVPQIEPIDQQYQPVQHKQLDKSQKIAVSVLAFFAILVVIIWITQAKRSLSDPFNYKPSATNQSATCVDGNCGGASEADLRAKDTDRDGLSDYDELNVYNTSPYLEDSDSDGYSDRQEVESQNNPGCPFGQQCNSEPALPVGNNDNSLLETTQSLNNIPEEFSSQMNAAEQVLSGQGDIETIRAVLLEYGMDPHVLSQIDDEELMSSYKDSLAN